MLFTASEYTFDLYSVLIRALHADRSVAAVPQKWKPLLTDKEQDEQYWAVINQGRQDLDASGGANTVR